jgi:hypothetical protein
VKQGMYYFYPANMWLEITSETTFILQNKAEILSDGITMGELFKNRVIPDSPLTETLFPKAP